MLESVFEESLLLKAADVYPMKTDSMIIKAHMKS